MPTVDSTGAADYFSGAFLAARARGLLPPAAARWANAVAAQSVSQPGATPELLDWNATQAWIGQFKK